jgi:Universal stress protein UspA and related nucleotide-binding proteins
MCSRTPHRRINGIADAERADLTIVGSRGQSPLANRVLGSTARNLSRTTVVPLLVNRVEREADDPDVLREHLFQRVLYATDFSENAERAFNAFSSLRHATQEATLVHVESPKEPDETDAADQLATLDGRLDQWDIDTDTQVRYGDPAEEILEAEAEMTPTTILLGSRGQSRLRRLLIGSVSETIIAQAASNVYMVPPPRTA